MTHLTKQSTSLSLCLSLCVCLCLSVCLPLSLSLSHTHTHTQTHARTHARIRTQAHGHTHSRITLRLYLWWSLYILYSFTRISHESDSRRLGSLSCLCDVFRVLINSLNRVLLLHERFGPRSVSDSVTLQFPPAILLLYRNKDSLPTSRDRT